MKTRILFTLIVAVATLVLLHLSILWARITQGRLGEPVVALRWIAAALELRTSTFTCGPASAVAYA